MPIDIFAHYLPKAFLDRTDGDALPAKRQNRVREIPALYDLDERRPWCVHDWDVPAPEEMLGLLVHLSIPGREKYLRDLPEH